MSERVDRDALIATVVGVMERDGGSPPQWHHWNREVAAEIINAVVARVADAIEADRERPEHRHAYPSCERSTAAAASLVRSFGEAGNNNRKGTA
jgi:hypothetical protein